MAKREHWNGNVFLMKFSSLATRKVVILTTFSAASDKNFVKMTTSSIQWISIINKVHYVWWSSLKVSDHQQPGGLTLAFARPSAGTMLSENVFIFYSEYHRLPMIVSRHYGPDDVIENDRRNLTKYCETSIYSRVTLYTAGQLAHSPAT